MGGFVSNSLNVVALLDKNLLNFGCGDIWIKFSNYNVSDLIMVGVNYRHLKGDVNNFLRHSPIE